MKLLEDIIDALSSKDGSLTNALLKTKILLHKIGHKELTEWVNKELNGYSESDIIPTYRVFRAKVLANAANIAYQINSRIRQLLEICDRASECVLPSLG